MPDRLVPLDRMLDARDRLRGLVHQTPMLTSHTAARMLAESTGVRVADGVVHCKAENLQKTGSFKPRGIATRVATLSEDERRRGVITLSAGNAGQAYAWAGAALDVPVTVVMPAGAVRSKVDACLGYGADVVLRGADVGATFAEMERVRDERGLVFCHPYDDPDVIAGHGSLGLEILEDLPDVDLVLVPIGGGGLISGVAGAIVQSKPSVRVIGVEPSASRALSLGIAAGEPVPVQPRSIADGLGAPFAGHWTIAMAARFVTEILPVEEHEILAGLRFAAERMKQVLEPAGAAALGALLAGRIGVRDGERVCVVLSGGNVEISRLGDLLETATAPAAAGPA